MNSKIHSLRSILWMCAFLMLFMSCNRGMYSGDITTQRVRGQDFEGFQKTIDPRLDSTTAKLAYSLFAKEEWSELEKLFTEKKLNGGWPPNRGFIDLHEKTLAAGATFDRFGGYTDSAGTFQDKGTFVAPYGADFEGRALPDATRSKPLNGYEVIQPITVKEGAAIPWFGKRGKGMQYELPKNINDLLAGGYIRRIQPPLLK